MKKTTAPTTPSPHKQPAGKAAGSDDYENYRREFFAAVIDMSWQLAIVVLVPVVGGFELDQKLNTLPALTIVGFFIAVGGMALVVWRQMQMFGPRTDARVHDGKGGRS